MPAIDLSPCRFTTKDMARIMFPSLLAIALFVIAVFGLFLPAAHDNLLAQKKQQAATLTDTGLDILAYYQQREAAGELSGAMARQLAVQQIRQLRFGPTGKDYFWINDLQPSLIMHPHRTDLEGTDVGTFADPSGKLLFAEMVRTVRAAGAGYVSYMWQWQDEPHRIVPKLSHVRLFEPWGWIIGTGIYLEDVAAESSLLLRRLIAVSLGILALITLLNGFIVFQGLREGKRRQRAEEEVKGYQARLEELVKLRTAELSEALAQVKTLRGFLPICASCKKIRDDQGYWNQLEIYITEHSEAEFSHGLCPECAKKLYPEYF